MNTIFVTGTDTGVGKTLVSQALVSYWVERDFKTSGFKPVAAGAEWCNGEMQNEDARLLLAASNTGIKYSQVNPCVLELATAPHIAAEKQHTQIDLEVLNSAYRTLTELSERIVVEGAGGWQVPLTASISFADWVAEYQWPVLLVVNIKLGCINHARLTYRDILRYGCPVAGWVANVQSTEIDYSAEMISAIKGFIDAPLIGCIPPLNSQATALAGQYLDFQLLEK